MAQLRPPYSVLGSQAARQIGFSEDSELSDYARVRICRYAAAYTPTRYTHFSLEVHTLREGRTLALPAVRDHGRKRAALRGSWRPSEQCR